MREINSNLLMKFESFSDLPHLGSRSFFAQVLIETSQGAEQRDDGEDGEDGEDG